MKMLKHLKCDTYSLTLLFTHLFRLEEDGVELGKDEATQLDNPCNKKKWNQGHIIKNRRYNGAVVTHQTQEVRIAPSSTMIFGRQSLRRQDFWLATA